jgi:hypothetical protein
MHEQDEIARARHEDHPKGDATAEEAGKYCSDNYASDEA